MKSSLTDEAFIHLCDYSIENLMLPEDALRHFVGLSTREPILIPPSVGHSKKAVDRFLSILTFLYQEKKRAFEEIAPSVRGTKRTYFGLSRSEVYSTGSANTPKAIPDSPWWVSVNSDGGRKYSIIYDLMTGMGFSSDYARMVASLCYGGDARLPWIYSKKYREIKM